MKFNDLCPKHRGDILALAKRFTGSPDAAEDLTQDTYIRAFRHWDNFKPETDDVDRDVKVWLKKILQNVFYTSWQREQKRHTAAEEYAAEFDELPDEVSPDVERLRRVMNKLRPMYREVLEKHYFEGHSYEFIAQELGIKFVQVQKRLFRARQYIKMYYSQMGIDLGAREDTTALESTEGEKPKANRVNSVVRRNNRTKLSVAEAVSDPLAPR